MNFALAQRHHRATALLLLVMIGTLFGVLLVAPYLSLYARGEERRQDVIDQLRQYQSAARDQTSRAAQLEKIRTDPRIIGYHLKNTAPSLAAAELQQYLQQTVAAEHADLISAQVIESSAPASAPASAPNTVTVRIRLRADITALQNVLYVLESGRPLLLLDNLFIRSAGLARIGAGSQGPLDVGFDATGYTLRSKP